MNEAILFLGQTALLLAGAATCVLLLVVIVNGVSWSVKQLRKLSKL
jgi:hypothetical protein